MSRHADFREDRADTAAPFQDRHRLVGIGRIERRVAGVFDHLNGFHPDDRLILDDQGALSWSLEKLGLHGVHLGFTQTAVLIVFVYLWLPFMVLPVYGALERIPGGLLEASGDLGGKGFTTFRRVVLPLALPGVVAGSIFTFSLTLGDFLTPVLVGNTQFIGNVIYSDVGTAGNLPAAAAYATVPIGIMAVYLLVARRLGAFESL